MSNKNISIFNNICLLSDKYDVSFSSIYDVIFQYKKQNINLYLILEKKLALLILR